MKKVYIYAIGALLAGLTIYLFYRTENTVVNELVIRLISHNSYDHIRELVNDYLPLPDFIIYSLPEGFWVFSVTLTSKAFYLQIGRFRLDGVLMPLFFSIGLEFLQLVHLTNGYFDILDIMASLAGWFIANHMIRYSPVKHNILQPLHAGSLTCLANYGIVYLSYVLR